MCTDGGQRPGTVAQALRMADAGLDYLNSPAADLPAAACGPVLAALGELQAKVTAAHAAVLRRFDAADAHDADGYGTSSAWLAAMAKMARKDAQAAVRRMRQLSRHPHLHGALGRAEISESWAGEIARWLQELPAELRDGTEKILADAAAGFAGLEDLAAITAHALRQWQAQHPDPDEDDGFDDRYVAVGTTFGGVGCVRGSLTPECNAAVRAVLEALGKKAGPEDRRTAGQRFHDALQQGCELLIRARMVPDRARHPGDRAHPHLPAPADARRRRAGGRLDPRPARRGRLPGRQGRRDGRLRRDDRPGGHRARRHDGRGQDDRAGLRRDRRRLARTRRWHRRRRRHQPRCR